MKTLAVLLAIGVAAFAAVLLDDAVRPMDCGYLRTRLSRMVIGTIKWQDAMSLALTDHPQCFPDPHPYPWPKSY